MTSPQFIKQKEQLQEYFRRFGLDGESAFRAIAYQYFLSYPERLANLPPEVLQQWQLSYQVVEAQDYVIDLLSEASSNDPLGNKLPEWYQFFIGRRYREDSGKFFTPKPIASIMAQLLPQQPGAIIMDPTCGGGTFLAELSYIWRHNNCTLIANDIETSLVELSMVTLGLVAPQQHIRRFISVNVFEPTSEFESWYGQVDYILANPPFSLKIKNEQFNSPLFQEGYRNSDALFIDTVFNLLKPGGRLVCLLPHSIVANKEFTSLRNCVEGSWYILGVICLPEGVFHLSAGTTTRADIVILDKKPVQRRGHGKLIFASVPSVGVRLNNRSKSSVFNDLTKILENLEIREALGL